MDCSSREDFQIAGDDFLRQAPWVLDADRETVQQDSWLHLDDSFAMFLEEGRERLARIAEREKEQRERDRVTAAESKIATRERRWKDYLLPATVPEWPGMPDTDREYRDAVMADKDADLREVTEENLERSYAVLCRYKHFKTDERIAEQERLRDLLTQAGKWALRYDPETKQEYAERIRGLHQWIDAADMDALRKYGWWVTELHSSLDPEQIRLSREDTELGLF